MNRIVFGRVAAGGACASTSPDAFFCPNVATRGVDDTDFFALLSNDDVRITPTWMDDGDYIDEAIPGDGWISPYHNNVICSNANISCFGGTPDQIVTGKQMFLMPVDDLYVSGAPLTKRVDASMRLPAAGVYAWTEDWLTLAFAPGTSLTVESSSFGADGLTFTASTPAQGWGGVRFEPGSGGSLTGGTAIEGVSGWGAYALTITDASPLLDDVTVRNAVVPSAVGGIRITGPNAYAGAPGSGVATMNAVRVRNMTSSGLVLDNRASARMTGNTIEDNSGSGMVAGYQTEAFLYPSLNGSRGVGNVFQANGAEGVDAYYADLTFGYYYYDSGFGHHNNGFNSSTGNSGEGVETRGGAYAYAGQSNNASHAKNRFFGNTGQDALASGTASTLFARCDWWDDTTPPFRTVGASGGLVYDDYWLLQDPYLDANASCTSGAGGGARQANDGPEAWLLAGAEAPDAAAALVLFRRVVDEAPEAPEAASALAQVARIAQRPGAFGSVAERAVGVLEAERRNPRAGLRYVAVRGLAGVRLRAGDAEGALALADEAAGLAGLDPEAVRDAHVERAYLLAGLGRTAEAEGALAAADALTESRGDVARARASLGLGPRRADPAARVASDDDIGLEEGAELLAPSPNPASGAVRLTLRVAGESDVRVTVYDVLGRSVVDVHDGAVGAGALEWTVDAGGLPPGIYYVRAVVSGADGAPAVLQRRFTVAR